MNNEYLLFTSAGDNTQFYKIWFTNYYNLKFDICIVYYGNSEIDIYKKYCKYYFRKKGSKFQNLYYLYSNYRSIFDKYNYFFIIDDDIIINEYSILKLFEEMKKYNLWLCQPSFAIESKIDYWFTKHNPNIHLLYSNFVEMNVPLFSKFALKLFMKNYDPILVGWGIDILYSHLFSENKLFNTKKIAIIHSIKCINPHEKNKIKKSKKREIDKIQSSKKREHIWKKWAKLRNYPLNTNHIKIYKNIN